jgi:hypothetical protein
MALQTTNFPHFFHVQDIFPSLPDWSLAPSPLARFIIHVPHLVIHFLITLTKIASCQTISDIPTDFSRGLFIALMMEVVSTSETSVYFNETTLRYISEDSYLHNRSLENLKSLTVITIPLRVKVFQKLLSLT